MSIDINEFSVTVPGNIVKTTSADGKGSVLRMTGAQARELVAQLGPVLAFIDGLASADAAVISLNPPTGHASTSISEGMITHAGSQEALKDQVDDGAKK